MSAWSDDKAATALRLISKRGQLMELQRRVLGAKTASGDRAAAQPIASAMGVYLPGRGAVEEGGQAVKSDKVYLAATSPHPEDGDIIRVPSGPNAGEYVVNKARLIAPDGGLIYSELEVGS